MVSADLTAALARIAVLEGQVSALSAGMTYNGCSNGNPLENMADSFSASASSPLDSAAQNPMEADLSGSAQHLPETDIPNESSSSVFGSSAEADAASQPSSSAAEGPGEVAFPMSASFASLAAEGFSRAGACGHPSCSAEQRSNGLSQSSSGFFASAIDSRESDSLLDEAAAQGLSSSSGGAAADSPVLDEAAAQRAHSSCGEAAADSPGSDVATVQGSPPSLCGAAADSPESDVAEVQGAPCSSEEAAADVQGSPPSLSGAAADSLVSDVAGVQGAPFSLRGSSRQPCPR